MSLLTAKIFGFILMVVFFTTSCGSQNISQEFPTTVPEIASPEIVGPEAPNISEPPEITIQEELFFKISNLIQEIIENPLADPKIREHLSNCEYFMQGEGDTHFGYEGDAKCLILVGRNIPDDYTIAVARSLFNEKSGESISYAIFYPYELSDETWKRIIYHEAVHMVDYLENPVCSDSDLVCSVNEEFLAHSMTMVLFQDYMIRNGFTIEQLTNVDVSNEHDPVVQFVIENSISQDDFNIFMQDINLLQATLHGELLQYLTFMLNPSSGSDM